MSRPPALRPRPIFEVLAAHDVHYVVIGGLAAVLHGSSMVTNDLDICPDRAPENLAHLADAVGELNARIRTTGDPVPFRADAVLLARMKMLDLITDFGSFDLTFEPAGFDGYDELVEHAVRVPIGKVEVLVASLDDVIRSKEAANRDKDRAMLPVLYALRDEIARRERGS